MAGGGFRKPPLVLNPKARALADVPPGAAAAAVRDAGMTIIAANGMQMSNPALMKVRFSSADASNVSNLACSRMAGCSWSRSH